MRENKLVQEALIQMKNVEEAIAENAKGILASTMKEEINQLVKESLSEQDEDEIELDVDADTDVDAETDNEDEMEMDLDMDVDGDEDEMDMDMDSMESPIDLTDASDEEILKVFKAMGEEDGIIIKKDGDDVHLTDNDADVEYLVKLGESEEGSGIMSFDDEDTDSVIDAIFAEMENMDEEDGFDTEEEEQEEGVMYEISLEEDEDSEEDKDSEEEGELEEEMEYESDEEGYANESYSPKKGMKKVKPKGVGLGSGPKFAYNKTSGGFKEDKKEGPKEMGTGKAKFDYKKGANMEGKSKVVKAETKEGDYGMNRGDKSKTHKGEEDYTTKKGMTKKTKAFEGEVDESMTIKPKGMGMNLKKKSFDLSEMEDSEMEDGEMKEGSMTIKPKGVGMNLKKKSFEMSEEEEAETTEAARTLGNGSKNDPKRHGLPKQKVRTVSESEMAKEVESLRAKNEEYRKALNIFREKLNEVAIFNSNLAYATRLFTEHSTTKKEKINILRRFDNVDTLKESKNLYKSIKDELSKTESTPINESVETKLNKGVSTGSSTTLIESKTYENPQFLRMKDLMSKLG